MKQSHKNILKRLANGPRTEIDLTTGEIDQTAHAQHSIRYLNEAQALGYCVKVGDEWMLTNAGKTALKVEPIKKQPRICALSMTEKYDGKELRQLGNRKNAYDFLSVPSLMHFGRVYRKDAII